MTEIKGIQGRLKSIDILRGIIIVLMALDHTRDFWGPTSFEPTDLISADIGWFFTRWVTHYCAPLFIFLSGISAFLYGHKVKSKTELRNFLLSRGVWLVFLEIAVVNLTWQFAYQFIFIQVIWVIGLSMIILAGLIYFPIKWIFSISLLVICLHNALDDELISKSMQGINWIWAILHHQEFIAVGNNGFGIFVAYPLIPWFAVMAIGYCAGTLYLESPTIRQAVLLKTGSLMILGFIVLRTVIGYGDPSLWDPNLGHSNYILSMLNTTKYPPSLQYLCMTLGPGCLLLAKLEKLTTDSSYFFLFRWFQNFGKVPMFFYLIHVPLINISAYIYTGLRYGKPVNFIHGPSAWPSTYEANLFLVYVAWIVLLVILYLPCKRFGEYKRSNKKVWLSYL